MMAEGRIVLIGQSDFLSVASTNLLVNAAFLSRINLGKMESIRAEKVVKAFGSTRALNGVSLEIRPGELFFLLGASGCGKSTLLRCIAGLETPNSGAIHFGERDVTQMAPHKREAAMVFQSYALWPHLTVAKNISFGLEERKVPKEEIKQRVDEALAMVKLDGFGDRSIDAMSGGQQQRVALARALVVRPKCLLLDEPLSNLDAQLRIEMRREIRRIVKEYGLTAVYVTHDQEEALAMADRMAILAGGVIEQLGTPEEIYRDPRTSYVAGFIGETNLCEGVVEAEGEKPVVRLGSLSVAGRVTNPEWHPRVGGEVKISLRPEAIRIDAAGSIAAKVEEKVYLGQCIQYWVATEFARLQVVELNPRHIYGTGDELRLAVQTEDVILLER
jgi:iron(III) transport system ATP-binding protein